MAGPVCFRDGFKRARCRAAQDQGYSQRSCSAGGGELALFVQGGLGADGGDEQGEGGKGVSRQTVLSVPS